MWAALVFLSSTVVGLVLTICLVGWGLDHPGFTTFATNDARVKRSRRIRRLSSILVLFVTIYVARFAIWRACPIARSALLPWMCFDPQLHMADRDDVLSWFGDRNSFGDGYVDYEWCYAINERPGFFTPALLIRFDDNDQVTGVRVGEWD